MVISVAPNYTAIGEIGSIMAWYDWTNVFELTKCLIVHSTPMPLDIYIFLKFVGFVLSNGDDSLWECQST